jgi:hypothetical protein
MLPLIFFSIFPRGLNRKAREDFKTGYFLKLLEEIFLPRGGGKLMLIYSPPQENISNPSFLKRKHKKA